MAVAEFLQREVDEAQVKGQLERMLADAHFSQSKRYPSFLRFVVKESLEGRSDQLKERVLGIEVFGRDPSYDTTADPIVRVAAAEIRKRIAQYYQDNGHESELRILLPTGSYVPKFEQPHATPVVSVVSGRVGDRSTEETTLLTAPHLSKEVISKLSANHPLVWSSVFLLILSGSIWGLVVLHSAHSALSRFWAPLLSGGPPILICLPSQNQLSSVYVRNAEDLSKQSLTVRDQGLGAVALGDMETLISISDVVRKTEHAVSYKDESLTTLTDLRQGPTVFLGAFDNTWTLRITSTMRFRFDNDADMKHFWIVDGKTQRRWGDQQTQHRIVDSYTDHAIVARIRNPETGQFALIAAGLTQGGTIGAGEFITQPAFLDLLEAQGPKGWYKKNIEVVISTNIIGGRPGPPKIVAAEFW